LGASPFSASVSASASPASSSSSGDPQVNALEKKLQAADAYINKAETKKCHPTEKPLQLMSWCLNHTPKVQTILDPWMGSGTTLVAAKQRGLRAIGIEINETYCRSAVARLAQDVLGLENS
jgi:DNA modification methylase